MSTHTQSIRYSRGYVTIAGQVLSSTTGQPVANAQVDFYDKDRTSLDDFLGTVLTNELGEFALTLDQSIFREFIFDRKPDLYFLVSIEGQLLLNTEDKVIKDADENCPPITLSIPGNVNA